MIYKKMINGKEVILKFNTTLMAMINYENYYGGDFLRALEECSENKEYTKLLKCISASYVSPTSGLSEQAIEEFIENEDYTSSFALDENFINKWSNALLGKPQKGQRKKKKTNPAQT